MGEPHAHVYIRTCQNDGCERRPFEADEKTCPGCGRARPERRADIDFIGEWPDDERATASDAIDTGFNSANWQGDLSGSAEWIAPHQIELGPVRYEKGKRPLTEAQAWMHIARVLERSGFVIEDPPGGRPTPLAEPMFPEGDLSWTPEDMKV